MDKLAKTGRSVFGFCVVVFGLQYFFYRGYAGGLPPMPPWAPGGITGAYFTGAILVVTGLAIAAAYRVPVFAVVLGAFFVACVVAFHFQKLSLVIHDGNARTRASEVVALGAIAWVIAGSCAGTKSPERRGGWRILEEVGRWLLAITLLIFGVQHFMYAAFVATLIPAWIPSHLFFTYFTGVGMVATGISIATKVYARLAGILLGSMFLFWVVFLHAPRVMAQSHNGDEWTSAFIALAMSAGAFVVAGTSCRGRAIVESQNGQH